MHMKNSVRGLNDESLGSNKEHKYGQSLKIVYSL